MHFDFDTLLGQIMHDITPQHSRFLGVTEDNGDTAAGRASRMLPEYVVVIKL
jgi:hypothetical protein